MTITIQTPPFNDACPLCGWRVFIQGAHYPHPGRVKCVGCCYYAADQREHAMLVDMPPYLLESSPLGEFDTLDEIMHLQAFDYRPGSLTARTLQKYRS